MPGQNEPAQPPSAGPPPAGSPSAGPPSAGPSAGSPSAGPLRVAETDATLLWSRRRVSLVVFFAGTGLLLVACYLLARPFLPAFAWALALAIVAHPLHKWIQKRLRYPSLAAGISVTLVAIIVVVPVSFVAGALVNQAGTSVEAIQSGEAEKAVRSAMTNHPSLLRAFDWLETRTNLEDTATQIAGAIGKTVANALLGSLTGVINLLIAFFILFYFFRDRESVMQFARSMLPLSDTEATQMFSRVSDTVFASIYGTLAVAMVQGTLGGLIFWWLGLPAPLLWGVVMGLLAIVPVLGAFVIWIPAAIFLAAQGDWGKALILVLWGTFVISLIDNLLYPVLVGTRMRLHTVPVFITIVGGLVLFGASGLIIGPVILSLTDAALNIWRGRTRKVSQ